MALTGTHAEGDTGAIADSNARDVAINANTANLAAAIAARPIGIVPAAITAAVPTSTTVETVILAAPIPANAVAVGTTFRIVMFGVTAASGNPTFNVRIGAAGTIADTLAATTGVITSASGVAGAVEFLVTFRAIGAAGSAMVNGLGQIGATANVQTATAPAAVTVDTTAARYITLTATMTASTFTAHTAVIAAVKP